MTGLDRIRFLPLHDKVVSAEKALELIHDGDVVVLVVQVRQKQCL